MKNIIKRWNSYLLFILLFVSCKSSVDEYVTSSNGNFEHNRVLSIKSYPDSKTIRIMGDDNKVIMEETLNKKELGYYRELKSQDDICMNKNKMNLILALKNEFYNSFECVDGKHEFYIIKLDDGNYFSIENVYGIISYSNKYYYDKNFKILKFEQSFGQNKIVYTNTDNPNYNIKLPQSKFLTKIKQDSIDYKKGYMKIN